MGERNNKRKAWGLWTLSDSPVRLPSGSLHLDQLEFRSINAARFAVSRQSQTPSLPIPLTPPANASGPPATISRSKIFKSVKS
jgi:hypothetical protein